MVCLDMRTHTCMKIKNLKMIYDALIFSVTSIIFKIALKYECFIHFLLLSGRINSLKMNMT